MDLKGSVNFCSPERVIEKNHHLDPCLAFQTLGLEILTGLGAGFSCGPSFFEGFLDYQVG